MTTLDQFLHYLRNLAPEESALPNDPVGLSIRSVGDTQLETVGICLDAGISAVGIAIAAGAQLVVAHHPLIFHPLKRIDERNDPVAAAVAQLLRAQIALYAFHTNWDRADGGINDTLAQMLGLNDIRPLGSDGAGALARIGQLPAPTAASDFARIVADRLACAGPSAIRLNRPAASQMPVSRIAVCGGSGASLLAEAVRAGAELFVTSDVKHNEFVDATEQGFPLIDAGHYATESPGMRALQARLESAFPEIRFVWCETG